MATTRRTTKKAAPKTEESPADVDTNDIPGLSEDNGAEETTSEDTSEDVNDVTEDTSEDTSEDNEDDEDDRTPIEIEMDEIPPMDNDFARMAAERLAPIVVELRECNDTILRNTLTPQGIEHNANVSKDASIVEVRTDVFALAKEIASLQEKLDALKQEEEKKRAEMHELSREEMKGNINEHAKIGAQSAKNKATDKYRKYANLLREELDIDSSKDLPVFKWLDSHQSLMSGGVTASKSTNGNGRSVADRQRSEEIRTWALNNGLNVKPKGRIPQHIIDKYEAAH